MRLADVWLAVGAMFLWALCYPVIAIGLAEAPPLWFAGLRALVAGVALIAVGIATQRPWPRGWPTWIALVAVGLTGTTLGFGGMFLGGGNVSPGIATVISNAQPLIAAFIAAIAIGERLTRWRAFALLLGFLGIATVSVPALGADSVNIVGAGAGWVLLAAFGVACGNVVLKSIAGRTDATLSMGVQLAIGALPLLAAAMTFEHAARVTWSARFLAALLVLAIPATAFANLLWFRLLERNDLNRLNTFTFLTPLFALGMGAVYFGERLSISEMAGTVLVIAALVLSTRSNGTAMTTTGKASLAVPFSRPTADDSGDPG